MESTDPKWIELKNKIKDHNLSNIIDNDRYDANLRIVREELHRQLVGKINPASFSTSIRFELYPVDDGPMVMSQREFQIAAQKVAIELGLVIIPKYNPDLSNGNGYQISLAWRF